MSTHLKLATVLGKTEKYMVHIKYLRLAMEAGSELDNVHGYFKFAQDFVFKFYIEGNNNIKADATKSGNRFLVILPSSYPTLYTVKQFRTS